MHGELNTKMTAAYPPAMCAGIAHMIVLTTRGRNTPIQVGRSDASVVPELPETTKDQGMKEDRTLETVIKDQDMKADDETTKDRGMKADDRQLETNPDQGRRTRRTRTRA